MCRSVLPVCLVYRYSHRSALHASQRVCYTDKKITVNKLMIEHRVGRLAFLIALGGFLFGSTLITGVGYISSDFVLSDLQIGLTWARQPSVV